ncbi:hypothetical protein M569_11233, partial [Genlisea aurea]
MIQDTLFGADFSQYNARTKDSLSCWNPDSLGFNLIEHLLLRICGCGRPGAVLVFLTGWDDIISLKDKLQAHPVLGDGTRTLLLPCHGSMSSEEQKLIFCHPPYGVRKIVLATNIAETSITIDDVVFVIDCGKAKETSYDALNNTPRLLPSWISKVSAKQRRGRAGRVQPGECYHLYPRCVYDAFADYQLPEILRTPLQSLCLQIKSLKIRDISDFLSQALISPEKLAVQNAIEYLKIIGALDESEDLTVLGRYLTMLPMEPKLGKMVILGAIFKCLDPILTVVAGLSVRDPFVTPFDKKEQAEAAKAQFSQGYSDHLALVRAYEGWKAAGNGFYGFNYCWINFLSFQSMKAIDSLRVEFYSLLKDTGLVDSDPTAYNILSNDEHLIRAVICYGLYPGICSIVYNQKTLLLKTMEDGNVRLNYSSVNARQSLIPYPWLVFSEKFKVNSVFLRDSTAVSDSMLILFGGSITRGDLGRGHLKMLGGYLEFFMDGAVAELYIRLRDELDKFIHTKLVNPKIDVNSYRELLSALRLVVSDDPSSGRFVLVSGCSSSSAAAPAAAAVQEQKTIAAPNCSAGENTKGELQTLMTRAGYGFPSYKTVQLNDLRFQSTVDVNGTTITGKACSNKKLAEKDAAGQALAWLLGEDGAKHGVGRISALLTKRKKDH